jgi:hypothetical protein
MMTGGVIVQQYPWPIMERISPVDYAANARISWFQPSVLGVEHCRYNEGEIIQKRARKVVASTKLN